jgi:hypothetical protein
LLRARTPSRKNTRLPLFRWAGRIYVALDRNATDRAIALARTFGIRGRVLIPPEELGAKGDLNDWLRVGEFAKLLKCVVGDSHLGTVRQARRRRLLPKSAMTR